MWYDWQLSRTEEHWNIEQSLKDQAAVAENRHLIREGSLALYTSDKEFAQKLGHPTPDENNTLYDAADRPVAALDPWAAMAAAPFSVQVTSATRPTPTRCRRSRSG